MSRFLKTMVVLLTIAAFAAPAFATDLSVSGQMRVEGFYNDLDSAADPEMNWDQRLRVQTVFGVADDVKVVLRMDIGEKQWGSQGQNTIRNSMSKDWSTQVDKAYLQIDKELFSVSAGQQFFGTSNEILVDNLATGLVFKLKTPVTAKLMFAKYNENGTTFTDKDATDDQDFYGAEVGFASDTFSVSGIYALLDDASTGGAERNAYGVAASFKAGAFALKGEFDILGGDDGAGVDYVGTQLYVDAKLSITESFTLGAWALYAAGTDDATEQVIYDVTNWDSFNPQAFGYVGSGIVAALPISGWGTDDNGDAGLITVALNATLQVTDDLGLKFQGEYAMEAEDAIETYDFYSATASGKYKVATNTYLMADVILEDVDGTYAGTDYDDSSVSFWTQLQVNF